MIFKTVKIALFVYMVIILPSLTAAQIAPSDGCATPPALPVNGSCVANNFTLPGSFANGGLVNASCSVAGNDRDDGWYTFVATGTSTTIELTGDRAKTLAIFSGCPPSAELACNQVAAGVTATVTIPTVIGNTYYVQVHRRGGADGADMIGTICVYTPAPAIANDNPCSATAVAVGASCSFTQYTNAGATATAGAPAPGCANYSGGDVWFTVTVPASGSITFDSNTGVMTDGGMAIYSGTCAALSLLACNDDGSLNGLMPMVSVSGQTPGATLWVRFWEYGNDNNGTFSLCAYDPSVACPPPANDNPCTATAIAVGAACSYTQYTNTCATATTGPPAPGCASYSGGDVWFTATVPASGTLTFDSNTGVITDGGMAIYSGSCAALTLIACDDDGSTNGLMPMITQGGLVPGSTIWIRFWEFGNDNSGTFSLCVYDPLAGCTTPANDDPCGATVVPVGATCVYTQYTNACATGSVGPPAPGCASYSGGDVWFSVTVPASGNLVFDSNTGVMTDGGMAIYSGTCGALSLIACNNDGSVNGLMPAISQNGLTPGSTIWIRFWEFGNNNNGTFGLCVTEPPPPPTNTDCGAMAPICSDTPITFTAGTGNPDAETVDPGNNYGCLGTSPNPTWFYLELLTDGTISIDISASSDVDFALWGPYPDQATAEANCNSYPLPIDCSYSISATEQVNYSPALANEVYVLLVTNYANVTQVIDLNSGAGNTALTDCSIILPIELSEIYVTAEHASNTIHWTTMSELSNDLFVVQRSADGKNFTSIGVVDGAGNSSVKQQYHYTDREYNSNLTYYRLKQVDLDGTAHFSNIVSVNRDNETVLIYPNPSTDGITIEFPKNHHGDFTISYKDMMGRMVEEKTTITDDTQSYSSSLFSELPQGVYLVEITNENGTLISVQKVIKTK